VHAQYSGLGSGTIELPYVITTCSQLQEIGDDPTAHYVLGNDIYCEESELWNDGNGFIPIGGGQDFWGTLDGNSFTIYDLYINRPEENNIGLFHTIEGGEVKNLTLERAYVRGNGRVGALAGQSSDGDYFNISVIDSIVISEDIYFGSNVGGIVGFSEDSITIENCSFNGTVTGYNYVGGLLGNGYGGGSEIYIIDSYNEGVISGKSGVGGLVGVSSYIHEISNSYNTGSVVGFYRVGGLVGYSQYDISITDSYNEGSISGYYRVGGLVGGVEEKVTILRSYNEGPISSLLENYDPEEYDLPSWIDQYVCVGGLVGAAWKSDISKSYNLGNMQALGGSRSVGGILGCGGLVDIQETYNKGDIETELTISRMVSIDGVGGLVGMAINMKLMNTYNAGNLSVSYWNDCTEYFTDGYLYFSCGYFPFSGGLVGTSMVSSVRNSYNRGDITIAESQEELAEGGVGGLFGLLLMDEWMINDIVNNFEKDFVERVTTYIAELINNFAVGLITNLYTGDNVFVGGLVGMFFAGNCTDNNCVDEYINFQNNWWFNGITKAIGTVVGDIFSIPQMYSEEQEEGRFERASTMEIFKTYSHKVYNTDPEWDFNTIWNSVYDGKGYPVLGIQSLVMPSAPVASVVSGTYSSGFNVSLSSSASTIRYTINGINPSCSTGIIYTGLIPISSSSVIKAIGCSDDVSSSLSEFTYIILPSGPTPDTTPSLTTLIKRKIYTPPTVLENLESSSEVQEEKEETKVEESKEVVFRIKIVDEKGNALVGAKVIFEGKEYITDMNGEIRVNGIESGEYVLKITHDGKEYEQGVVLGNSNLVTEVILEDTEKKDFPWWVVIAVGSVLLVTGVYAFRKKQI